MVRKRAKSKKEKFIIYLSKNWQNVLIWLLSVIVVLLLTKTCDRIWPDTPVVVKEYADTVKVVHTISPLPNDSDSAMRRRLEQQLMNIELLNKYDALIASKNSSIKVNACKAIVGNPYPKSSGYSKKSASSFCYIEMRRSGPFIDLVYSFFREDYVETINTLSVIISQRNVEEGKTFIVFSQDYEPQKGKNELIVRLVDDLPSGNLTLEAGFIFKEDRQNQYPSFYCQTFTFKK